MSIELFLGLIIGAVIGYGSWAIIGVIRWTFTIPDRDMSDEVDHESEWLRAVSRAARR